MSGLGVSQKNAEKIQFRFAVSFVPLFVHSGSPACSDCLADQLSTVQVIHVEGGGEVELVAEVCCPQCRVSTQQDQLTDHVLAEQVCTSCEEEEESLVVARCEDCQEFLCLDAPGLT